MIPPVKTAYATREKAQGAPEFKRGDLVQVIDPGSGSHGMAGTVTQRHRGFGPHGKGPDRVYSVEFPDLPGVAWRGSPVSRGQPGAGGSAKSIPRLLECWKCGRADESPIETEGGDVIGGSCRCGAAWQWSTCRQCARRFKFKLPIPRGSKMQRAICGRSCPSAPKAFSLNPRDMKGIR